MSDDRKTAGDTDVIGGLIARVQSGDVKAREELLAEAHERLRQMASRMLDQKFVRLRRYGHAETGIVLNQALLGLYLAFDDVELQSPEHFINLAALKMRRALLDLCRKVDRQFGTPAGTDELPRGNRGDARPARRIDLDQIADPLATDAEPGLLDAEVLEEIDRLPADERGIIDLVAYGGRTYAEAASVLQVSEKTVRRRFNRALASLVK